MLPDLAIRDLRQAAHLLLQIDLWDKAVLDELRRTSERLLLIADRFENKVVEFPLSRAQPRRDA
jgi:hypothetical protein